MSRRGPAVVIDTNVWISGILTRTGYPAQLTRRVIKNGQPVFSPETFVELKDRLWQPKFDRYVSIEQRQALLGGLQAIALWVDVPPEIAAELFCRDATDDKFIHTALAAKAGFLITGDKDLLILSKNVLRRSLRILAPADAIDLPGFLPDPVQ
jgi:putative PIN family toxin of toxin-antitoxin system